MATESGQAEEYRRIDALLEARARDYPRRVEPTWSNLLDAIDGLSEQLRASAAGGPSASREIPSYYDSPTFVVGHRKTGTTLMLDLLDGHSELVALPGESNHFLTFLPRFGALPADRIAAEAQRWWMLRLISPSGISPFWALGQPWELAADPYALFSRRLIELAAGNPERDVLGLAAAASQAARGGSGSPRVWVEKTPGQEHEVGAILERYPAARFVQLVRDPRSVAAAIARLDRATDQETDLVDVGLTIRRSFAAAERNVRRLGEDRYLVVRYEDLVAEPETAMRRTAGFVGIDWADSLLTPTVGGVAATSNSAWATRKTTGRIESGGLELWREELDERSREVVTAATRRAARRFGYELHAAGVHARAEVTVRRVRGELGRRRPPGR